MTNCGEDQIEWWTEQNVWDEVMKRCTSTFTRTFIQ